MQMEIQQLEQGYPTQIGEDPVLLKFLSYKGMDNQLTWMNGHDGYILMHNH